MNLFFWKRKILTPEKTLLMLREEVAVLRRQIFPKKHTSRYWIEAKFPPLEYCSEEQLKQLIDCLISKRDQYICPIHGRKHASTKRSVERST